MLGYGSRQPNLNVGSGLDLSFGLNKAPLPAPTPVTAGTTPMMNFVPSTGSTALTNIQSFNDPISQVLSGAGVGGVVDVAPAVAPVGSPAATGAAGPQGLMGGISSLLKGTFGEQNKDGQFTGLNMDNILSAIGAFGGLWGASKQLGLAKDSLNFQKETFRTNTENQRKTYNTAIEDRARSRYSEGNSSGQAKAEEYINRNRL